MQCANCGKEYEDALAECPHCTGGAEPADRTEAERLARERESEEYTALVHRRWQVNTHLVGAILATVFCCWPLGIIAIVYAAKAEAILTLGEVRQSQAQARKARIWMAVSIVLGLVAFVLKFPLGIIFVHR